MMQKGGKGVRDIIETSWIQPTRGLGVRVMENLPTATLSEPKEEILRHKDYSCVKRVTSQKNEKIKKNHIST